MIKLILAIVFFAMPAIFFALPPENDENIEWKLNTSNQGKLHEFQRLFSQYGVNLSNTNIDLDEVDADPVTVVAHKASQLDELILVEDTSLDIEGATVGVNIRWLIENLDEYIGNKAIWKVLLAYRSGDEIIIYKGEVRGTIVPSTGNGGFGFDAVFLPEGALDTLAQSKPDIFNARALAVQALMNKEIFTCAKAIYVWDGPWQSH